MAMVAVVEVAAVRNSAPLLTMDRVMVEVVAVQAVVVQRLERAELVVEDHSVFSW